MTDEKQQVREAIDKILKDIATQAVLLCPDVPNEAFYTNQILSLTYPNGQPMIGILTEKET